MSPQRFDQALFSEFLSSMVERFGYPVGVECERVARGEPAFLDRTMPFFEKPQDSAGGIEPFKSVIAPQEKSGEMPAIRIPQAPRVVVIFGKEEGGVDVVGRILVKELVHGFEKALRLIQSDRTLAAQIRLQIGHQKSSG